MKNADHSYDARSTIPRCSLCGEPMPEGEEMFKFHGYSGPCPKPPLPKRPSLHADANVLAGVRAALEAAAKLAEVGSSQRLPDFIRALDPAAIAATVEDVDTCELCDGPLDAGKVCVPCWNGQSDLTPSVAEFEQELAALRNAAEQSENGKHSYPPGHLQPNLPEDQ